MREGQPRTSDLVVTRPLRIEDAARDVEMRFGVAVPLQPSARIAERRRRNAKRGQGRRYQQTIARTSCTLGIPDSAPRFPAA